MVCEVLIPFYSGAGPGPVRGKQNLTWSVLIPFYSGAGPGRPLPLLEGGTPVLIPFYSGAGPGQDALEAHTAPECLNPLL